MPFVSRPHPRVPVCCPMTYEVGHAQGTGTVWNLSASGFRFSTDVRLAPGQVCAVTVELPNDERVRVAAGIVRWMLNEEDVTHKSVYYFEYGIEVLVASTQAQKQVMEYLKVRVAEKNLERTTR
jgi:hypothetical protein